MTEASAAQPQCDTYPDKPAMFAYQWPWGETGFCSHEAMTLLRQQAKNLKREIAFAPLPATLAPPPLSRDERIRLNAEIISLREELEASKQTGLAVYTENDKLKAEGRRLLSRTVELEAKLADARADLDETERSRRDLLGDLAECRQQYEALKALMPPDGESFVTTSEFEALRAKHLEVLAENEALQAKLSGE